MYRRARVKALAGAASCLISRRPELLPQSTVDTGGIMSITSISSAVNTYPNMESSRTSSAQSTFSVFEQLASALQSNNLTAAQQAYNTLSSMMPNASSRQSNSCFATAFQARTGAAGGQSTRSAAGDFESSAKRDSGRGNGRPPSSLSRRRPGAEQLELERRSRQPLQQFDFQQFKLEWQQLEFPEHQSARSA
jgi:hypothetical protein